jgi:hypothetical protein
MTLDKIATLKRTALFRVLDDETLRSVAALATARSFTRTRCFLSLVRRLISRSFSRLQQDGLIIVEDRTLTIPDEAKLTNLPIKAK